MKPTDQQSDDRRALLKIVLALFALVTGSQVCFLLGVMVGKR